MIDTGVFTFFFRFLVKEGFGVIVGFFYIFIWGFGSRSCVG